MNGKPLIYLDSAASAQKPRAVIEAMTAAMEGSYANVHRGLHTLANETTDAYEAARESVRRLINAASANEIVFTKGATEAINLVASSFGQSLQAGDEIVRLADGAPRQHRALALPARAPGRGAAVRPGAPTTAAWTWRPICALLGPRTRMVALTHMSNVLGTINPVQGDHRRRPCRRRSGAARRLPRRSSTSAVDVQALDADFYVFSGHKLYGPTGIGVLYGKAERLAALPPYQGGGEMIGDGHAGAGSPTPIRRTGSRPARRRSSRPSAWARPSTGWRAWTATPSPPTSTPSTTG